MISRQRRMAASCMWALSMLWAAGLRAEPGETVITARSLTFDYKTSTAVLVEDVVVNDARMNMRSDKMTVVFAGQDDLKSVTAIGNVRLWEGDKKGFCDKAVYDRETGAVVMTGNARLERGRDVLSGDTIRYWLDSDRVVCEPARLVIYPGEQHEPIAR